MSLLPRSLLQAVRAGGLLLALAAPAGASELSWDGPAECAQAEQLRFLIEGALGRPLEHAGELDFHVRVDRAEAPAQARLSVTSPEPGARVKQRVLVAANCAKLVDTLAVAISLIVGDREAAAAATPAATASSVVLPLAGWDIVPSVDTAVQPAAAEAGSAPAPSALAFVVADVGSLPSPALGAAVGLELAWSRVQLRALGTLFFEQHAGVEAPRSGPGGDLNFAYATLLACAQPVGEPAAPAVASLCAGLDAGRMSGVGTGVTRAWERSVLWLAPRLDAVFSWRIPETQLRLSALLGGAVPLNRDVFILDALGTVHRPAAIAGHAGLGVNLLFE